MTASPYLDAALAYAAGESPIGVPLAVVPLLPSTKKTAIKWGAGRAPQTPDAVSAAWRSRTDHPVAVVLNPSRLVVLDVEGQSKGFDADGVLDAIHETYGPLPATLTASTSGGGMHFYFRVPDGVSLDALPKDPLGTGAGFEFRKGSESTNGSIAAVPALLDGREHDGRAWLDLAEIAELPPAFLNLAHEKPQTPKPPTKAPTIGPGDRHAYLLRVGGAVVRQGGGYEEVRATIAASNEHRCSPPKSDDEVEALAKDLVGRYPPASGVLPMGNTPPSTQGKRLRASTIRTLLAETPEEREWVWEGYIAAGNVTGLVALPKVGKSTLLGDLVRSIVTGAPEFLGAPLAAVPVYLVSEESKADVRSRYGDLVDHDNLHVITREHIFEAGQPGWEQIVSDSVEEAIEVGARLVIYDTLRGLAGVQEENDGKQMTDALKPLQMAAARGLGVVIVHHSRKAGGGRGTAAAGSAGFFGALDLMVWMTIEGGDESHERKIEALGRWDSPGTIIASRVNGHYRALGAVADYRAAQLEDEVLQVVAAFDGPIKLADIRASLADVGIKAGPSRLRVALANLTGLGKLEKGGKGNAHTWSRLCSDPQVEIVRPDMSDDDLDRWQEMAA